MTPPHFARGATSTGIAPGIEGAFAYVLGPITGIVCLLLEKQSRFVRFHAAQSIVVGLLLFALFVVLSIVSTILAFVPVLGWIAVALLNIGLGLGSFILWLALIWRAYLGEEWELPFAGPLARRMISTESPS